MMKQFKYRLGNIEARIAVNIAKDNKETIEVVEWKGDSCQAIALFSRDLETPQCSLLQNGIRNESPEDLMKVIKAANEFLTSYLTDKEYPEIGFHATD